MCCKNSSHLKSELVELTFVNMSFIFFFNYVVSYFFYFIAASVGKYEGETFSVLPCSSKFFANFFSF